MKLGKFAQWFYRKRLTSQFKTFGQLQKGDFVWRVMVLTNGEIKKDIFRIYDIIRYRNRRFVVNSIHITLDYDDFEWGGDDIAILLDDAEYANVNFVYRLRNNKKTDTVFFTNEKICDSFIKTKVMQRDKSIEKRDVLNDLECAIDNANKFLMEQLIDILPHLKEGDS